MSELNCRHFTGYKPCGLSENCTPQCSQRSLVKTRILVVHLEALGAVLRTTSILPAIVRKYPGAHITWVTQKPADQLLKNNPLIDRILTTERDDLLTLGALSFDVAFCVDKSLKASGVLKLTTSKQVFVFVVNKKGIIVPDNIQAEKL